MSTLAIHSIQTNFLSISPFKLESGDILFIQGESGSGKSLLLRAIADIDQNDAVISLDQQPRQEIPAPDWRTQVGLLPARAQWWGELVKDSLHCNAEQLKSLSLPNNILSQKISRISSGENQRLSLLRLLQNTPKILLLDEPTANLDQTSALKVEQYIIDYLIKHKTSAIWVSHNEEQIKRISQQLTCKNYRMKNGTLNCENNQA